MCVAGCEAALRKALTRRGFFAGAAAGGVASTSAPAAEAIPRSFSRVVDLTHTMSPEFPTFCRQARHRDRRVNSSSSRNRLQLELVACLGARRHASRRAVAFLRERTGSRQPSRRTTRRCRLRS